MQYGITARDGSGFSLRLDGQYRKATLAGEVQVGEALLYPFLGDLGLDQGLVPAEVHVVYDGGGGHRPGYLCAHVPLGFYDPVRADPLEYPRVKLAHSPRHDERHAELLEDRGGQDAGLHVLPDDDRSGVELGDVQVPQDRLVGGVRGDQVGVGKRAREILDEVLVGVYPEHLVPEGLQGAEHGAPQPPEPYDHELTAHPMAMSSSG